MRKRLIRLKNGRYKCPICGHESKKKFIKCVWCQKYYNDVIDEDYERWVKG